MPQRFRADEIMKLVQAFEVPNPFITRSRYNCSAIEAFCLLCARFRSAADLHELTIKYRRSESALSEIVNEMVIFLDQSWGHLLGLDHESLLSPSHLETYAKAIRNAGVMSTHIWAFIDCTIREVCRPTRFQRQAYNGHKKHHAIKFQALALPNGLIGHLHGPVEGRRADGFLLADSGLLDWCREHAKRPNDGTSGTESFYHLFGDPAYGLSDVLISPFSGPGERTRQELEFNKQMSALRIEVEHVFGNVLNKWGFLRSSSKMRVYSSPVGCYYRVGVLLANAMNCLRPNQTSQFFECAPPSLQEYLHR
ncbi:hypothetical protein PUNSTDRAFT_75658 [Punctularia strigosozonata HHB-11173 SS5]|uniref:DDE Tnp4 domain-containing protein n=1 Tax=Punctularia strigosozonata (strain HHB-11173) TaxID=741275 RepID=R7S3X3_PUNST|nr:uncharacterized protein PUNSTDRAFT_75658 [Punctularia strigosozonata HHB-11173 SS5]EIN04908.1 hypothetical protein PUNSTDRAFT_75658 [Punctularia strigosozonata HHB-11173 SS5]